MARLAQLGQRYVPTPERALVEEECMGSIAAKDEFSDQAAWRLRRNQALVKLAVHC